MLLISSNDAHIANTLFIVLPHTNGTFILSSFLRWCTLVGAQSRSGAAPLASAALPLSSAPALLPTASRLIAASSARPSPPAMDAYDEKSANFQETKRHFGTFLADEVRGERSREQRKGNGEATVGRLGERATSLTLLLWRCSTMSPCL